MNKQVRCECGGKVSVRLDTTADDESVDYAVKLECSNCGSQQLIWTQVNEWLDLVLDDEKCF